MKRLGLLLCFTCLSPSLWAWSNHTQGTYLALAGLPALHEAAPVAVEDLDQFLARESAGLVALLDEQEAFARTHIRQYPPRPDALRFDGHSATPRQAFLEALRLNPHIRLANAIQPRLGESLPGHAYLALPQVLVFRQLGPWAGWRFLAVQPGEPVAPLAVLASAADEPDYGHDIDLFSDSPGAVGQHYGFGPQPFGDPGYEFSSQAPFHMGFYHESALIFAGAPYLQRSWPAWRAYQFQGLARYAFAHDHPYWGYRFLGWAMHYLQDLTQPYHATPLPGEGTAHLLWIAAEAALGFDADKRAAIRGVAERHLGVERYQLDWLLQALRGGQGDELLAAYADSGGDGDYPAWSVDYLPQVVAPEAQARAADFDAAIGHALATIGTAQGFSQGNVLAPFAHDPQLDAQLLPLLRAFGAHSRNLARATLSP